MGRKRAKKVQQNPNSAPQDNDEEELKKLPHSFVFNRGHVGKNIGELVHDMRHVMEPFTASKLKVRRRNVLNDFVNVAGPMNISHFLMFSKTDLGVYLRVTRVPRGPTLTFKVHQYSLSRDVVSTLKKPNTEQKQFQHHPLLVINGLSGDGMQYKLMATMFQNLFPSINVNKVKLTNIRRCVLLNYNSKEDILEFRHYNIKAVPVGMSRGVKKIVRANVPNLGRYDDVSEYLLRGGDLSESEAELDGPHNEVVLPQSLSSRGNIKAAKSAIRLTELGPRLSLQLVKIEEGLCDGSVLYHQFITKSPDEVAALSKTRNKKKKLKERRKKQQEENVIKKQEHQKEQKRKCLAGMNKPTAPEDGFEEVESTTAPTGLAGVREDSSTDDEEYYRREVGAEPEPELFPKSKFGKRKQTFRKNAPHKRQRLAGEKTATEKKNMDKKKKPLTEMDRILRNKKKKKQQKTKKGGHKMGGKGRPRKN